MLLIAAVNVIGWEFSTCNCCVISYLYFQLILVTVEHVTIVLGLIAANVISGLQVNIVSVTLMNAATTASAKVIASIMIPPPRLVVGVDLSAFAGMDSKVF